MNLTTSESPPGIKLATQAFLSLEKCTFTNKTLELLIQSFRFIHSQVVYNPHNATYCTADKNLMDAQTRDSVCMDLNTLSDKNP